MLFGLRNCRLFSLWNPLFMLALLLADAVVLAPGQLRAQSPHPVAHEIRDYDVSIKQSPVGKVSIDATQFQDGAWVAVTDTVVNARYFLVTYHYDYHGKEIWQNERLVRLESQANDNGTKLGVTAASDARSSRLDVLGTPTTAGPPLVMTSNYWRLPDLRLCAGNFTIVDSDTGKLFNVRIGRVGTDTIAVGEQNIACSHYRVSGDTSAELWYDSANRLVRQQTTEQGNLTEVRLLRVRAIGVNR
jgi:hypothetical protein